MSSEDMAESQTPELPEEIVAIQIIVTKDNRIKVVGPGIANDVNAYGLLEKARQFIYAVHQKMNGPVIESPGNHMINWLRNGKR